MTVLDIIITGMWLFVRKNDMRNKMELAKRISKLQYSVTIEIADKVRELEQEGEKIIKLQTGEPHFPTPDRIKSAAINAINENKTHYSHSRGIYELRKLLCEQYNKNFETNWNAKRNILITPGGKQAILYMILSVVDGGDEVLIPTPSWVSYFEIVNIGGGIPVPVECEEDRGFELSFKKIKQAVNKKTKAIILNSPNNPTGKIIPREVLERINKFCVVNDIFLICDEIYDKIIYNSYKHYSIVSINPELRNCALINGFSKTYSMAGWRLGYVISTPNLIKAMLMLQQHSITCPTTFTQFGAIEALESGDDFVKKALKTYRENKDILLKEFKKLKNFRFIEPEGGLYAFIDISKINSNSSEFCLELLDKGKVAATPGVAFGENGEGYIRICLATEKVNIVDFVKRLKEIYD